MPEASYPASSAAVPDHTETGTEARAFHPPGLAGPPPPDWAVIAEQITFDTPFENIWEPGPRNGSWFTGGRLNLSVNCLDRHLDTRADQVALHWEGEPGDRRSLTYRELHDQVVALSRALRAMGVGLGDRVGLHLGWLPETVITMMACARIGAVHTMLPVPLPVEPLAQRLDLLDLKVLFTQDGAWRHGTVLPLKARADDALLAGGSVEHTIVVRRTGMDVAWFEGDRWFHDLLVSARPGRDTGQDGGKDPTRDGGDPVSVDSAHPLVMVPLANKGGHPVSVVHGTATLLASVIASHERMRSDTVFWCAGDIAWAVTQFHGILAPLAAGDTAVAYEGTLDVPNHRRAWDIIGRYDVGTVLTSPAVMRTVRGWAREMPAVSAVPSLRRVVTAGEPVESELGEWLSGAFGGAALEVADAWGQLELGGIVRITPGEEGMPDSGLDIVDRMGAPVPEGDVGEVVLGLPWPATMVDIAGQHTAFTDEHWTRHPGWYSTGDLARRLPGGQVSFLGRTDDVVSIAGQLVSLGEVSAVLAEHPYVQAADATWRKDPELGRVIVAGVVLRPQAGLRGDSGADGGLDGIVVELMETVREVLGGLARPRAILVVDRFGDELRRSERAQAIATLATSNRDGPPRRVSWSQVLAAAGQD